ncbi:response regulator transcription factor [Nakamurella sp. GG22]
MIGRASAPARTVLLCDQHPVTRRVLTEQLAASGSHLQVVSAVRDAAAVVDAFTAHPTDVVLIGIRGGAPSGPRAVDALLTEHPTAPVIVYGTAADSRLLAESIHRGAQGLMLWDITPPSSGRAIRTESPRTAAHRSAPPTRPLTALEHRVLRGMSLGHSNYEIGRRLSLPEQRVKTRCHIILGKLGARDRAHAVALGLRDGLLN